MMRVCAITSGARVPAARFRIRQHIAPLAAAGIDVVEHLPAIAQAMPMPGRLGQLRRRYLGPVTAGWLLGHAAIRVPAIAASWRADAVWLERVLAPGFDWLMRGLKTPIVLDVDDAVWLEGLAGRATPRRARAATAVIAGNQYLADWFRDYCDRVHVIPTAVDCARIRPVPIAERTGFVIGWTGTSGNFRYLAAIEPALEAVLRDVPGASLLVVADRPPALPRLAGRHVRFVPWSPASEVEALAAMDVGLMPLADDAWTRGKCSFKMLQYMAAGVPSVVSPVGMNREVLALGESGVGAAGVDEWVDALRALAADSERRTRLGATGRAVALAHFDVPVVSRRIAAVFESLR
ncbi:MAG: glycosyltransferase family 4 protein [Vicinamibacteria bacterium]|jgi:glycosyltransferase involved in cell wall biosynthesis